MGPRARPLLWLLVLPLLLVGRQLVVGRHFLPAAPAAFEPWSLEDAQRAADARGTLDSHAVDGLLPVWSDRVAARESLEQGAFPAWDARAGLGAPLAAQSVAGFFYPPNLATLLLPPELALGWLALLSMWLAGVAMHTLLGAHGLQPRAALLAALAWQGGAWTLAHLHLSCKLDSLSWMLLSSAALQAHFAGRARMLPALGASVALSFLAGFPQLAMYGLLALALQALAAVVVVRVAVLRAASAALFVLVGIAAAAVWLLPLAEAAAASLRGAQSAAQLDAGRLPVAALASLVVPDLYGAPEDFVYAPANAAAWLSTTDATLASGANGLEWNLHLGPLLVAAALAALSRPARRLLAPLLLVCAGLACLLRWPFFGELAALPGLSSGVPSRASVLLLVGLVWLAAHGLELWFRGDRRALVAGMVACGLAFLGCAFVVAQLRKPGVAEMLLGHWSSLHQVPRATVEGVLPRAELERQLGLLEAHAGTGLVLAAAATIALFLCRMSVKRTGHIGRLALAALVVALAAPTLAAAGARTAAQAAGPLLPPSAAVEAVRAAAGDARLVRHDRSLSGVADVERLLRPGLAQAVGVADLTPWIVFQPRTLVELWSAADPPALWRSGIARTTDLRALEGRIADELRIGCVLAREPLASPRLEVVHAQEGFVVHRRGGVRPMAACVPSLVACASDGEVLRRLAADEPGACTTEAELRRHGLEGGAAASTETALAWSRPAPDRLQVDLTGADGGFVLVREQWDASWTALVDGVEAPVLRANHALRAVPVPQGARSLELRYQPAQLCMGAIVSLLAWAALLLVWRMERRAP